MSYLYFPQAAKRIRQCVPDARLVALLRHPVDRAYSKYRQLRRDGAEPLPLFEQALAAEIGRMQQNWSPAWFYVDRGFYYRQIGRYYELFDPRQIHVVLYDEFVRNPKQVLTRIFNFLNIDEKICIDVDHKYNVFEETNMPRSMFLYDSIVRPNWFSSKVRDVIPTGLLKYVRPIAKMAVTKKTNGPVISPLDQETRNKMIHLFREDILQLQDLINKDLSSWIGG